MAEVLIAVERLPEALEVVPLIRRLRAAGIGVQVLPLPGATEVVGRSGFEAAGASVVSSWAGVAARLQSGQGPAVLIFFPVSEAALLMLDGWLSGTSPSAAHPAGLHPADALARDTLGRGMEHALIGLDPRNVLLVPALARSREFREWHPVAATVLWPEFLTAPVSVGCPDALPMGGTTASPERVAERILRCLTPPTLANLHVVVSAGPTRESLDPVRFISNHSTGRMGYDLARVALRHGARVTLVTGPSSLSPPPDAAVVRVSTAAQLCDAMLEAYVTADILVMAAAVADYAPAQTSTHKLKKSGTAAQLELIPTTDILTTLGARRRLEGRAGSRLPVLIGFAMETQDLIAQARAKVIRKGCDFIVANNLNEPGAGFGHATNRVSLIYQDGQLEEFPLLTKEAVAGRVLDQARTLHARALSAPTDASLPPADPPLGGPNA